MWAYTASGVVHITSPYSHFVLNGHPALRGFSLAAEPPANQPRAGKPAHRATKAAQKTGEQMGAMKQTARRSCPPIKVYCTAEERQMISAIAQMANMSLSSYLLTVGQGYRVESRVDQALVAELAHINGDLGRLGGLLKLWLSDEARAQRFGVTSIRSLLHQIEDRQMEMGDVMRIAIRKETPA